MTQGTISILFGCHSIVHSFLVLLSWRKLYGRWPKRWQVGCIFIHDIGHLGLNYLDDQEQKRRHWQLGAYLGLGLWGWDAWSLCAGHQKAGGFISESLLYRPDKYSWYIAPRWWIWFNTLVEPKTRMGYGRWEAVKRFKEQVRQSIESGEYRETHQMFIERCVKEV